MTTTETAEATRAPRKRRRPLRTLLIVLLLAGLLVGADQIARIVAQTVVADRVQSRLNTATTPSVTIGGFPFLSQVVSGEFGRIEVTADAADVNVYEKQIALTGIQATATDVVARARYEQITAGQGELTGVLPYAAVQALTGLQFSSAGEGKVQVSFDGTFAGTQVSGTATGRPQLDVENQRLSFTDVSVSVADGADVNVANAVVQVVFAPIPVEQVPFGLRVTAVEARDDGIRVTASGQNLPLRTP